MLGSETSLAHHESLLAQWIEHVPHVWEVMGSIPVEDLIVLVSPAHDMMN